jgi:hypothetical protein
MCIFYAPCKPPAKKKYSSIKFVFHLSFIKITIFCRSEKKKIETAPKIKPVGIIRRNGLF